ncbi:CU044_5270 family protein [Streptosporangium sp. NBC_01469]|uniref:CU044_5270 family protein n=1 Tax=Streptosporangium sp. NBC_01469 TaxID=2903898 RepID=UPI002E2C3461|nr:CU044_5270 family protein [Streptosporangium sp. NBC_01469]
MKRKDVLDVLAAARPADLDPPGTSRAQVVELRAPVRSRHATWLGAVAASLATVSVIAVMGVPRLMGQDTVTGQIAGGSSANVLDMAADRAAGQRQTLGRYWHTSGLILGEQLIGSPDNRYRIRTRAQTSRWVPPGPEYMVFTERGLPTVPASAADEQAWRRAGAPKLCGNDSNCGNDTAPLGRTRFMFMPSTWPIRDQGLTLSASDLLDLPRDPDVLKKRLLSFWPAYEKTMAAWPSPPPGASLPTEESWLLDLSLELLEHSPISAGTRAALYRMVASLPGTRALGQVRDAEGRLGIGVGWRRAIGDGWSETQLIVDEPSGRLLALQHVVVEQASQDPPGADGIAGLPAGSIYHALVYQKATWTDTPPTLPADCPAPKENGRNECLG